MKPRIWFNVEKVRELELVVELVAAHGLKVELESLGMNNQSIWQLGNAGSSDSCNFSLAVITVILVITIKQLAVDKQFKRPLKILLIFHFDGKGIEIFQPL